jgi:2-polyprenyl-3-methyl-5-hydroxy-6-metoxy-1,4-benzoquinol methylase
MMGCQSCRHLTLDAPMDAGAVEILYTTYYPRSTFNAETWSPPEELSGFAAWWRGERASAYRWVPRNVRVLDIGCGFGEALGYHRNRGCDAHGVEADANILRVAQRHGLNVRVGVFDSLVYEEASFDVVTLDQVIEHLGDPVSVLRGVARVLRPGGQLLVSTPNAQGWGARAFGRFWIHWHAPYHQQFFSRESMQQAAQLAGLRLEAAHTITNSAWLGFQWCHLLMVPREGDRSAFWDRRRSRTVWHKLRLGLAALFRVSGFNAAVTRLFDGMGLGDNWVFVVCKPAAE